jgi:TfoX/Sxy family transcriptional regulator of competence genes
MAYSDELAGRVRKVLFRRKGSSERKMFGGICYLLSGNMCCGVLRDELILRLSLERAEKALKKKRTRVFDMTGRPMKGFVVVSPEGIRTDEALKKWLVEAADYASSLPPK